MEGVSENFLKNLPDASLQEMCEVIFQAGNLRVERIVSRGQASPEGFWCDQDQNEWVMVLAGEARLCFSGPDETVHLKTGDYINIEANRRHRVDWTLPDVDTVWLAIHYAKTA